MLEGTYNNQLTGKCAVSYWTRRWDVNVDITAEVKKRIKILPLSIGLLQFVGELEKLFKIIFEPTVILMYTL